MIRLGTLLWLALIALASVGLFQLKDRVQAQEQELTHLDRQIERDREEIQVLRAEWSHLNEPNRLADLARRHLDLAPVAGIQVVRFEVLPARATPVVVGNDIYSDDPTAAFLAQLGGVGAQPGVQPGVQP